MNLRRTTIWSAASLLLLATAAEAQVQRITANMRGNDNKCTFEIRVDGIADVEIHGSNGYLRTIQGSPASWVRLDCGRILPNNPNDFRFRGIDGRGNQTLIRDPRSSGGVAVIRIEDRKGGSENYTGDIMWSGGDSHWGGGGNWASGGSGWNDNAWGNSGIDYKEAVRVCREQVARVRNVQPNDVSVRRGSMGGGNSDYDLDFTFANRWNASQSGKCLVTRTGRLANFNITGGGYNDRISANEALTICEKEVERRLMIGPQEIRVQHGVDPGNGSSWINWQARRNGQIRTGQCLVSANGRITDFTK